MVIAGVVLIVIGLFFCATVIGALIGVPMIIIGLILCIAGASRRKTVIQNVVTVTNAPHPTAPYYAPQIGALPEPGQASLEAQPMPQIQDAAPIRVNR
jgi:hypothetical protein